LYCGGIIKLRVLGDQINPFLFYALLNLPFVRRQMRNKQFTRDVIDTLGKRLTEVVLPIPKDRRVRDQIATEVETRLAKRNELRKSLETVVAGLYP
jgi:hypothetical protein